MEPLAVGAHVHAVFEQEFQATARQVHLQADPVLVIGAVVDLGVLGQVSQDTSVIHARLDFGLEGPVAECLADGRLQSVEPVLLRRADRHGFGVMGLEHVEERPIGHLVGFIQDQERGVVLQSQLGQDRLDRPDLALGLGAGGVHDVQEQVGLASFLERRLERRDQARAAGPG